jgi:hypothetical protein
MHLSYALSAFMVVGFIALVYEFRPAAATTTGILFLLILGIWVSPVIHWSGFWRRWVGWEAAGPSTAFLITAVVAALSLLTAMFTVLTALLLQVGLVGEGDDSAGNPVVISLKTCLWHLLDAIPIFKVPETLGWELKPQLTGWTIGVLLLTYKITAIIPVVGASTDFIKRGERPDAQLENIARSPGD